MKKNWKGKILFLGILMPLISVAVSKSAHTNGNGIRLNHEIMVVKDRAQADAAPIQSVSQHTPPAPYNNVTFTITAPAKVCVGQIFTIDYAVQVSKFTHISFWTDLIPDASQGLPVKYIDNTHPTLGAFESEDESLANKGGQGVWLFPKGLPGNSVQHLSIRVQATAQGLIKFSTLVATNPPFYIGTQGTLVACNVPVVNAPQFNGLSGQPLEIPLLDYVLTDSMVEITSISQAAYGSTQLNEDQTITYIPYQGFYGNDSFTYSITDAAGHTVNGTVAMSIQPAAVPQIIA